MPIYTIRDPQTNKTIKVKGDSPPTEAELTQLFSANQPAQPQATNKSAYASNPIINLLLGKGLNLAQDIGVGVSDTVGAGADARRANQSSLDQSAGVMDRALAESDPQKRLALLKLAQQGFGGVSKSSMEDANQYSPDIKQNPILRGILTGTEVATLAGGANSAVEAAAKAPSKVVGAAKTVLNPRGVLGELRSEAAQKSAAAVDTSKIVKAAKEYADLDPGASKYLENAVKMAEDAKNPTELLKRMKIWKNAYTAAGRVGKTEKAGIYDALYRAGSEEIKSKAPEVAKYTKYLKYSYQAPKTATKALRTAGSLGLAAGGLGLAGLFRSLSGK